MEEYVEAKSAIVKYQKSNDFAVINTDYEPSVRIGKQGDAKKFYIQTVPKEKIKLSPFEIYKPESYLEIKSGVFAEELHGGIYFVEDNHLNKVLETKDSVLRGFHNVENIAAALMVSKILNISENIIAEAVREYKGLEHRLEFVCEKNKIKFYNDSIGTTPQSSLAAIKAFNEMEVVIIGGADKKVDYEQFAEELSRQKNIKAIILIGDIGQSMKTFLDKVAFPGKLLSGARDMTEIFKQIKSLASPGDVVLLAPGTSSFGMFKDYKDRGNQFKEAAKNYS
ncbi:MAG: hypothetical protein NVSMB66_2560 [Candidatus Doudnabacteria bacterium]